MSLTRLLPHLAGLRIEAMTRTADRLTIIASPSRRTARCPACGHGSGRIRSRYVRTITDLPIAGQPVVLQVSVRRFRCHWPQCPQRIFAERLPALTVVRGRRTHGQRAALTAIGLAVGGLPGARLGQRLGIIASRATLLRFVRAAPVPQPSTPRVLGVDDWAFRKGNRYGTIVVDLETHRPIDLLPERHADRFADWLKEHPGVTVISRDRAQVYADGARRGAPQAVQVADRWHLLGNLTEALERLLLHERAALQAAAGQERTGPAPLKTYAAADQVLWQQRAEAESQQRHAPKLAQYEQIVRLHAAGAAITQIAEAVAVSRRTVYRYLSLDGPPERKRPHRSRHLLTPYESYLRQRWTEGCHNKSQLFRELRSQGYTHGARNVFRFLMQLEREQPARSKVTNKSDVPSARHVAGLLSQQPERLTAEEQAYLTRLCAQTPTIAAAYELAQAFAAMLRERQGQDLGHWLVQVADSGISELRAYARGLEADRAAVEAGLRLVWSNGQTEGHVNRLKLIKRQMYGRAKLDLLRQRVLSVA